MAGVTHSFYLVTNDHGDVLELLDADHLRFAGYRYDAYGRPTEQTVRTTDTAAMTVVWSEAIAGRCVLRYAGYCWDEHSGLYYLQHRYYDPITRQFTSSDPLKSDGDESLYQYCGGSPLTGTDPTGEQVLYNGDTSSNSGLTKKQRARLNTMTAKLYGSYGAAGVYYYGSFGGISPPALRTVDMSGFKLNFRFKAAGVKMTAALNLGGAWRGFTGALGNVGAAYGVGQSERASMQMQVGEMMSNAAAQAVRASGTAQVESANIRTHAVENLENTVVRGVNAGLEWDGVWNSDGTTVDWPKGYYQNDRRNLLKFKMFYRYAPVPPIDSYKLNIN